jgi:hypothetical protein
MGVQGSTAGVMPAAGVSGSSETGRGVYGESAGHEGVLGVSGSGNGVLGLSRSLNGVQGRSDSPAASGVYGENNGGGWGVAGRAGGPQAAVWGDHTGLGMGTGVRGTGSTGVSGESSQVGGVGVMGMNNAGTTNAFGVFGASPVGVGVRGDTFTGDGVLGRTASGNAVHGVNLGSGLAGRFDGNVQVNGTLTKFAGFFLIDHPLDPANKYLRHSFVESSEMVNTYSGNVVLDGNGAAVVELPDWFDTLNGDFRYGLTPVGAPGPDLHVAREIENNRFTVAGGPPGLKVSWSVTALRRDPYALQNPLVVEEDKAEPDRGKYLYPAGQGHPKTLAIHAPSPLGDHDDLMSPGAGPASGSSGAG